MPKKAGGGKAKSASSSAAPKKKKGTDPKLLAGVAVAVVAGFLFTGENSHAGDPNGGWAPPSIKVATTFDTDVCNIERLAYLSEEDFLAKYDTKKPFILTNVTDTWSPGVFR
jgi:hypothetical protein